MEIINISFFLSKKNLFLQGVFLLQVGLNYIFLKINSYTKKNFVKAIVIAYFTYIIPYFFCIGLNHPLLIVGFAQMLITDIFEYSLFALVPGIWISYGQIYGYLYLSWAEIFTINAMALVLFIICKIINMLSIKYLGSDGIGQGDILVFAGLIYYIPIDHLLYGIVLSSFLGLLYALGYFIIFFKKIKFLPYIPFLYLGISFLFNKEIYIFFQTLWY